LNAWRGVGCLECLAGVLIAWWGVLNTLGGVLNPLWGVLNALWGALNALWWCLDRVLGCPDCVLECLECLWVVAMIGRGVLGLCLECGCPLHALVLPHVAACSVNFSLKP